MLIVSPNFIITDAAEAALPAGTPLILWNNIATFGTVTQFAGTSVAGYPASNLSNPATNTEWRAASGIPQVELLWYDPAAAHVVDAIGIARHNFASAGIAVDVGYHTGPSPSDPWVSIVDGPQMPINDEPILFRFAPFAWNGLIVRLYPGTEAPRAAVMYVGKMLVMERGVDINPDFAVPRFARRTEFTAGRSERGDYLGRIVTSQWIDGVEHTYKHLTPAWYRSTFDPFVRSAQAEAPFFYCFAPVEQPYEVAYVWLADDPIGLTNPATRRKGIVLRMAGIIE